MAASKKKIKQGGNPKDREVKHGGNPDSFYRLHPSWNFANCDTEQWAFTKDFLGDAFWLKIFPKLQEWSRQTWDDILKKAEKQNHPIDVENLNKIAQKRLDQLHIEKEAIYSLRIDGTHRIYGYLIGSAFMILWYDPNHGDNDTCVCRSHKKHT